MASYKLPADLNTNEVLQSNRTLQYLSAGATGLCTTHRQALIYINVKNISTLII
jgi:hypothetical protein